MQTPTPKPPKPVPPPEFKAGKIEQMSQTDLIAILRNASATVFQRAKACQRLASIGAPDAVPALAALLTNARLAHYARYGLEPIPGPSVDDALRAALPKLTGRLLMGVIDSIGHRRDAQAVPALARLLHSLDLEVAQSAAAALGSISGLAAAKVLQDNLARTKGAVRAAVAAAGIVCAEGLLASGNRAKALDLYTALTTTATTTPVRLAAMHGIIAAETSLNRPR
jgi:HEAT repeat protein